MEKRLMNETEMLEYMEWLVDSINEEIDYGNSYWVDCWQERMFESYVDYVKEEQDIELEWNPEFDGFDKFISDKLNENPMCLSNYSFDFVETDKLEAILQELSVYVEKPLRNNVTGDSSIQAWYNIYKNKEAKQ